MSDTNTPTVGSSALLGWLRGKLAQAENALRCREEMVNPRKISEEEWEALKAMPGTHVIMGRKLSKAALKEIAEAPLRHKRIAARCRHEVEMFQATIAALTKPNNEVSEAGPLTPNTTQSEARPSLH